MTYTAKVLAVKHVDFTNEKNEKVCGFQVWVIMPTDSEAWNGHEVMKIWVSSSNAHAADAAALMHDDTVCIEFNRYGKPVITEYYAIPV